MLLDSLHTDLKQAQLAHDEIKVSTLRMLLSEIRYVEIQKREGVRGELSDEDILTVIGREIKKRKESITTFRQGGREDLAAKEEAEAQILFSYLPAQLSDEELMQIINKVIKETGATQLKDMGKVMSAVMSQIGGRAEGSRVSNFVKEELSPIKSELPKS